jgi:hypothetical protein
MKYRDILKMIEKDGGVWSRKRGAIGNSSIP